MPVAAVACGVLNLESSKAPMACAADAACGPLDLAGSVRARGSVVADVDATAVFRRCSGGVSAPRPAAMNDECFGGTVIDRLRTGGPSPDDAIML